MGEAAPTTKGSGTASDPYSDSSCGALTNLTYGSSGVPFYWSVVVFPADADFTGCTTAAQILQKAMWSSIEQSGHTVTATNYTATLPLRLVRERDYRILAIAAPQGKFNKILEGTAWIQNNSTTEYMVNNEGIDFYHCTQVITAQQILNNAASNTAFNLVLKRPFGKLRILANDHPTGVTITSIKVQNLDTENPRYHLFDFLTGTWKNSTYTNYTFNGPGAKYNSEPSGYKTILVDYIPVPQDVESVSVHFKMEITFSDGAKRLFGTTRPIEIHRNKLTTIMGDLFTGIIDYDNRRIVDLDFVEIGEEFNRTVSAFLKANQPIKHIVFQAGQDLGSAPIYNYSFTPTGGSEEETKPIRMEKSGETLYIRTPFRQFLVKPEGIKFADNITTTTNTSALKFNLIESINFNNCVNSSRATTMESLFENCASLLNIYNLAGLSTSNVTSFRRMFLQCSVLPSITLPSTWDISKVTTMYEMFDSCKKLTSITIPTGWVGSSVTTMQYMFWGCSELKNVTFGSGFNASNLTIVAYMFNSCTALSSVNFGNGFNARRLPSLDNLFSGRANLKIVTFGSNFNGESVTTATSLFSGCTSLQSVDFGDNFNVPNLTTELGSLFNSCKTTLISVQFGNNFNAAKVSNLSGMLSECTNLTNVVIGNNFNAASASSLERMFYGCTKLQHLAIGADFNARSATSMKEMFAQCTALLDLTIGDRFYASSVTSSLNDLFNYCQNLKEVRFGSYFDAQKVTDMNTIFGWSQTSGSTIECKNIETVVFGDYFNAKSATSLARMFEYKKKIKSVTFGQGFNAQSVTTMERMFSLCDALENVTFGSNFNATSLTDMSWMFAYTTFYNNRTNPITWGSNFGGQKVTNLSKIFYDCSYLTHIRLADNLCSAATSKVDLTNMFEQCGTLVNIDMSGVKIGGTGSCNLTNCFKDCGHLLRVYMQGIEIVGTGCWYLNTFASTAQYVTGNCEIYVSPLIYLTNKRISRSGYTFSIDVNNSVVRTCINFVRYTN